jgi:DNA-directed RNA polymerase II subunit RPB2
MEDPGTNLNENIIWDIIDCYFRDNPQSLVRHHIESYNDFYKEDIFRIFKEMNPITIVSGFDEKTKEYKSKCNLYLGGKSGKRVYFAKPVIYDGDTPRYMFPNEARLRNMTYSMTIHYDVEVEIVNTLGEGEDPIVYDDSGIDCDAEERRFKDVKKDKEFLENIAKPEGKEYIDQELKDINQKHVSANERAKMIEDLRKSIDGTGAQIHCFVLDKILLGRFPIMVQSDLCILSGLPKEMRFNMGECKNDVGGYFIIDGKEKTVIPQEKFGDNMLRINKSTNPEFLYSAEIKSVSENSAKPVRSLRIDIMAPTKRYSNYNIVVNIPMVRAPVPLFIVFRALGFVTDREIIEMCLLDMDKYENLLDDFIPSIHDAGPIMTQLNALQYIAQLAKYKTVENALYILSDFFLPHIGESNFVEKAYYLGYMVKRLLLVSNGLEAPIDRDSYRYKRIELTGTMIYQLFREYFKIQTKTIYVAFERILYNDQTNYANRLDRLILNNFETVFKERNVETGFKKAYKGKWGATEHTKRIGAVQDLNRLSFNSALSHLRKTNLQMDSGAKLVGPRILNGSQWGLLDPIDTPDGGNIGLHKQLSILTYVTRHVSRDLMVNWLKENVELQMLENCTPEMLSVLTKVFVNGYWAGSVKDAIPVVNKIKFCRRLGLIPTYISVCFDIKQNAIMIFTDGGRLCRPIFYRDDDKMSYEKSLKLLTVGKYTWDNLISGFTEKKPGLNRKFDGFYKAGEIYEVEASLANFKEKKALFDYLDPNEEETSLIAFKPTMHLENKYTHCEIHESLIFGMMCNMIIYPHHNPATRNSFSCGQSKQAVSLYHTNYNMRMDKTAVILNQGQKPLVKSRYLEYINNEENSYGENAIVAIACYTGYNMEDSVLINEGALKRGLFRTTYFSVYETHEEKIKTDENLVEKKFTNIEKSSQTVIGQKMGYDYSKLDKYGLVKEGTEITDETIIIGMTSNVPGKDELMDHSESTKKGQLGIVHKVFITDGEEGTRIAKVKVREERIPAIGDKMASRSGQKGTIGMIVPEQDMPFTKDGLRPDIIINPHALPTRMTIGQLVECIVGKACLHNGFHGDCTAFNSNGNQLADFQKLLTSSGMHSSGNDVLYNGMTGEQIESEIFMGPTYYMRLKHMVKDKVNFRARGPMTQLTRQPVSGRANDGGLRIGEMERDSIISHGATEFLKESMLVRGDQYYMAVCNKTGGIAIYNPDRNMFMSPLADGPLKFVDSLDGTSTSIEHVTKFGRSFSVVRVPYVFKLFMQELQAINVKMAIITEDNVDQFDNMNFSRNISLLSNGKTLQEIVEEVTGVVDKMENVKLNQMMIQEDSDNEQTTTSDQASRDQELTYKKGSKVEVKNEDERKWYTATILNGYPDNTYDVEFADDTQEYNVPEHLIKPLYGVQQVAKNPVLQTPLQYAPPSPDYTVHSPDYMPRSPDYMPRSPDYMPRSQDYMPRSPDYIPRSPDYTPPGTPLNHFKVGDLVSYTKDFKNRMWKIDDLEGAYVTVATEDTEGLERNYKVVPLNELTPYVPSSPPAPAPAAPQTPVVNVIVGDNNSVTPPEKPMQSSSSQSSSSQSSPQDSSSYGLSSFSLSDESSDFSTPRVRIKEDTKASVSDSKLLSGGSIVVKKI